MAEIKTYARIKPTSKPSKRLDQEANRVSISVPQLQASGQTRDRTATLTHQFGFAGAFGPTATQPEVFDLVAAHIVDGFLAGYNGTIFAYGQTGSGKTYTIEGSAQSYSDRGLAPRALSRIYKSLEAQKFDDLSIKVSYLEIYQEVGYDLLNPTTRPGNVVAHLPKVTVTDGPSNSCVVRNLSMHLAADERVAQTLLHQGQASRKVAETPMNQRSSRSHAVFTIYLKARLKGSDTVNKSKLHLVDLAGSERVAKTKIAGQQLHEAKSINLSLHHLEGVIIALQGGGRGSERGALGVKGRRRARSAGPVRMKRVSSASSVRSLPYQRSTTMGAGGNARHIPYRNSLLTMVLRDSLGGNCLTAMVATVSAEDVNLSESLSTCRFAMRVASIQNKISRNEVIDDKTIITRLRRKISVLEEEVLQLKARLSNEQETEPHQSYQEHPATPATPTTPSQMQASLPLAGSARPPVAPANGSGLHRGDRRQCARLMQGFVSGRVMDPVAAGVSDFASFRECLRILREMILRSYAYHQKYAPSHPSHTDKGGGQKRSDEPQDEVKRPEVKRSPEVKDAAGRKERTRTRSNDGFSAKTYKSPFEKKRERSISRLGKSLETQIAEQRQQKKDLMEFKTILKQQQLENAALDVRNKISMTNKHLVQQQELVRSLRQAKASRDQLTAEKIAEKQLAKRLAKYEKRYALIQEHQQIVHNHLELQRRASNSQQATNEKAASYGGAGPANITHGNHNGMPDQLEQHHPPYVHNGELVQARSEMDSTSQSERLFHAGGKEEEAEDQSGSLTERMVDSCRHKSGKVDAKRVLDVMHREEHKRNKEWKQIERERMENFNQHFALREEATLTKLKHFKEQLRQQQEARRSGDSVGMRPSCDDHVQSAWAADDITRVDQGSDQSETLIQNNAVVENGSLHDDVESDHQLHGSISISEPVFSDLNSINGNLHFTPDHVSTPVPSKTQRPLSSPDDGRIIAQTLKSEGNGNWVEPSTQISDHGPSFVRHPESSGHAFNSTQSTHQVSSVARLPEPYVNASSPQGLLGNGITGVSLDCAAQTSGVGSNDQGVALKARAPAGGPSVAQTALLGEGSESPSKVEDTDFLQSSPSVTLGSMVSVQSGASCASLDQSSSTFPGDTGLSRNGWFISRTDPDEELVSSKPSKASSSVTLGSLSNAQSRTSIASSDVSSSTFPGNHALPQDKTFISKTGPGEQASSKSSKDSLQNSSTSKDLLLSTSEAGSILERPSSRQSLDSSRASTVSTERYSTASDGRSFDTALSMMLKQGASENKNSGFLTSRGVSSRNADLAKDNSDDVTTLLKAKLLGYLGGQSHVPQKTLPTSLSSLSSLTSLPEKWSIPDSATSSTTRLPVEGDSISKQGGVSSHFPDDHNSCSNASLRSWNTPVFQIGASSSTLNTISEDRSTMQEGGFNTNNMDSVRPDTVRPLTVVMSEENLKSKVKSLEDNEGERSYLSAAKENKARIAKIRKAINSAGVIQSAWRKYRQRKLSESQEPKP